MQLISRGRISRCVPTDAFIRPNRWVRGVNPSRMARYMVTLDNLSVTSVRTLRGTTLPLSSVCLISYQPFVMCDRWLWRVTENQSSIPERQPERRLPRPRTAAGTQITQSQPLGEVVTKSNDVGALSGAPQSEWPLSKQPVENLLKGKSGASSRGNSSFSSIY